MLTNISLCRYCRTFPRATLNCRQPPHSSIIKRFSHGSSLFFPTASRVLFQSITGGPQLPVRLSFRSYVIGSFCRTNQQGITALYSTPVTRRWTSGLVSPSKPALDFDDLKVQKFDDDVLLYSYNNVKACVMYNVVAVVVTSLLFYATLKFYREADLEQLEEEWESDTDIRKDEFTPIYRYLNLAPYRGVLSGIFLLAGGLFFALMMRYTLRSINYLALLKDGKTLVFSTTSPWGSILTRKVPVGKAHTENLNSMMRGCESCEVIVQGTQVSYLLDARGKIHDPYMLRKYLGTEKENKKRDIPADDF